MVTLALAMLFSGARIVQAAGGPSEPFSWSIPNQNNFNSAIQQCTSASVTLYAGTMAISDLTPPFTMFAFPSSGIPVATTLSGSGSLFSYTPPFGTGTKVTLGLFDSIGNSGGYVGVYTVALTSDSTCIPQSQTTDMSVRTNSTSVDVCDTLGISISGGTAPYRLNILPFGTISDYVNTSIPPGDTGFNWVVNTTTPNTMMIGVNDATGTFAASPPTIAITGINTTCYTQSSDASGSSPSTGGGSTSGGKKSNIAPIIGGVVGGVGGAALLAALLWLFVRRRRRSARASKFEEDGHAAPSQSKANRISKERSDDGPGMVPPRGAFGGKGKGRRAGVPARSRSASPEGDGGASKSARVTPFTSGLPDETVGAERKDLHDAGIASGSKPSTRPSTAESAGADPGRGGFGDLRVANPDAEAEGGPSSRVRGGAKGPKGVRGGPASPQQRVVQHEDGGTEAANGDDAAVEELPPAYTSIKRS